MKKILLLGGSAQQVVAIERARECGYYTILCDYLPDNPGQYVADEFFLVSTTDKEAVLRLAKDKQIDAIVAYASDPAAPTAAYVAEKMGLPGNPYESVVTLCHKDLFRNFLKNNGFNTPVSRGYGCVEDALRDEPLFLYPIIIKPVDSSGSKGVTVLFDSKDLKNSLEFAFSFSRAGRIVVEKFIERAHPYLIGGDVFVVQGKIVLWGLLNCHRDPSVNALVPVGKSYPLILDEESLEIAKVTLQELVTKLNIHNGAMNVELIIDKDKRCWLIDVGPRNGGNMIPELLGYIFDVDVVNMTLQAAMGLQVLDCLGEGNGNYATHNLHTNHNGKFVSVWFSDEIAPYILKKSIYKKPGDFVEYFDNASKAIGIVFLKFDDAQRLDRILKNVDQHIKVIVETDRLDIDNEFIEQ